MSIEVRPRGIAALLVLLLAGSAFAQLAPVEEAKLKGSENSQGDFFGSGVALFGDTAVVGAEGDDLSTSFQHEGTAYVFVRSGTSWSEQARLSASDAGSSDQFGSAVAVWDDTAVIGAWADDHSGLSNAGSACVFVRSGSSWTEQAKLTAPLASSYAQFGISVAVSGDTAVIGANLADLRGLPNAGTASVFVRSGTRWSWQATLKASDATALSFGTSVAVSGDTVVVGAPQGSGPATADGSAYVFVRSGSQWTQQAQLVGADAAGATGFGRSVSVWGDTLAVGADQTALLDAPYAGSAAVYVRSGTAWQLQARLAASDAAPYDHFGRAISVTEGTVLVGASDAAVGSQGDAGVAYLFVRSGASWTQQARLTASGIADDGHFGASVALSGDTSLVGGPEGSNGGALLAGKAWVHTFGGFTDLGGGLAGSSGIPQLSGTGTLLAGSGGMLALGGAAPSAMSALVASFSNQPTPFKGGVLHPVPALFVLLQGTSPGGGWTLAWLEWPPGIPPAGTLFLQATVPDPAAVQGVAISNLLRALQP
jgi:hypothetical protein